MKLVDWFIETEKTEVKECFKQFLEEASEKRKKKIMNNLNIILEDLNEEANKKFLFQKKLKKFLSWRDPEVINREIEKKVLFQRKLKALLSWRNPEAIQSLNKLNEDNKMCLIK
jgi:hypothetical protein